VKPDMRQKADESGIAVTVPCTVWCWQHSQTLTTEAEMRLWWIWHMTEFGWLESDWSTTTPCALGFLATSIGPT